MIWLAVLALAAVALTPLVFASWRRDGAARGRRDSAVALHRMQLDELDRDRAEGRLPDAEHATARLEVQRRLLAAADTVDAPEAPTSRAPLLATLALVPLAAIGLYLIGGSPDMPAATPAIRQQLAEQRTREDDRLLDALRRNLARMDNHSTEARQGYLLLGNAEASRQNLAGAAAAWRVALAAGFDPTLAVETAEAITEAAGHLTDESRDLFRRALVEAPPDAPWRAMAERRLSGTPIGPAPALVR